MSVEGHAVLDRGMTASFSILPKNYGNVGKYGGVQTRYLANTSKKKQRGNRRTKYGRF
jgi:hypothetical protein